MTLANEYTNQNIWRNWPSYIEMLPLKDTDIILDLGCGTGHVAKLLSEQVMKVISVDANIKLLDEAKKLNSKDNIEYAKQDLRNINESELPLADGIWTSFVAAYFPDFSSVLKSWLKFLKPKGWIAVVEINDLFAHFPINLNTQESFKIFYKEERIKNHYDYEMGSKLTKFLTKEKLSIIINENKHDKELSFNGPADEQILKAWESRLNRLIDLQEFFGKEKYSDIKLEFLDCLAKENHTCKTKVRFVVAKKITTYNKGFGVIGAGR
jgi:ubiquinone/menaquinone biosynthesis C-methylase UbiE